MNDNQWYDELDHTPYLICKCLLSNGDIVDGIFTMGEWNNMDGEVIYPTHFQIDRAVVMTGIYSFIPGR